MMNPFVLNDLTIPTISQNISGMILNYFECPLVQTVVFSYGFHGRRREVYDRVMDRISAYPYRFIPYLLWCQERENIKRMRMDNRCAERIQRTMTESRKAFEGVAYPQIDITDMSALQAARTILSVSGLSAGA